jgi:hypothetical protein
MRYSVSPRVVDHRLLPKPSEKVSTLTPNAFATMRWPHSWTKMMTPRAKAKDRMLIRISVMGMLSGSGTPGQRVRV